MSNLEDLIKVVLGAVVGAAIALITSLTNHWLGRRREREHVLYGKLIDKFLELEEVTGFITEQLTGYRGFDQYKEDVFMALRTMDAKSGAFRRYRKVNQAIRDFMNSAGGIMSKTSSFPTREERDQAVQELEAHHRSLLQACDDILGRKL
jgi:hypothetical protein